MQAFSQGQGLERGRCLAGRGGGLRGSQRTSRTSGLRLEDPAAGAPLGDLGDPTAVTPGSLKPSRYQQTEGSSKEKPAMKEVLTGLPLRGPRLSGKLLEHTMSTLKVSLKVSLSKEVTVVWLTLIATDPKSSKKQGSPSTLGFMAGIWG